MSNLIMKDVTNRFICRLMLLLGCSVCLSVHQNTMAQSTSDIEAIIKKSNGVDATCPMRTFVNKDAVIVSTFCHPNATDQDCKINSLFIMKALMDRYSSIHRLRITFYDSKFASGFRTLDVTSNQAHQIDAGTPVQQVLAKVNIVKGQRPAQTIAKTVSKSRPVAFPQTMTRTSAGTAVPNLFPGSPAYHPPVSRQQQQQQQQDLNDTLDTIYGVSKRLIGN